jgi:hypothetical protein
MIGLDLLLATTANAAVSWATVAAVASAVAATTAVILTFYIFAETRRMRLAQTEPHVGASVVGSEAGMGFADLVVRNSGPGAAIDIRFEPIVAIPHEPDAELLRTLRELGIIKHGMPYLAPGGEYRTYIAQLLGRDEQALQTNVHLRMTYRSSANQQYESCYPIELKHFANRTKITGTSPLQAIARELESIRREIEKVRGLVENRIGVHASQIDDKT